MKKLILLSLIVASFVACKKEVDLTKQSPAVTYPGIKNVADFDRVINEITHTGINKRSGTPNTVDKIRLSKEAIMEMRSSLQFYNGQFRGFNKCGKMKKELNIRDQLLLNEALCGTPIRILDKDEKLIAYSEEYNLSNFVAPTKPHIIIHDHRPLPANSCVYFYDATCFVYGNF